MRTVLFATAALLALGGCGQQKPAAPTPAAIEEAAAPSPADQAAVESTDEGLAEATVSAPAEPGTCVVYLKMERAAVLAGREKGDAPALESATAAWTKVALQELNETELQQFEASSLAVLRDTPPDELKRESDKCVAQAPKP